jgi:hypothetical protein
VSSMWSGRSAALVKSVAALSWLVEDMIFVLVLVHRMLDTFVVTMRCGDHHKDI